MLVPASAEHVRAELGDPASLGALLCAVVPPSWPPDDDRDARRFLLARLERPDPDAAGWFAWYAVRRARGSEVAVVVGSGGYFGPPGQDGVVEIGYAMCPEWRGKGYATEIARALSSHAAASARVRTVIARTNADNLGSIIVLERAGFCRSGEASGSGPGQLRFEWTPPAV